VSLANWFETSQAKTNFENFVPLSPLKVLQIGAWSGDATQWLINHRTIISIDDVDPWNSENQKLSFSPEIESKETAALKISEAEQVWDKRFYNNKKVRKNKMDSNTFFLQNLATFDFIYIDGDHTAIQVALDAFNAYICLSKGGVLAFDDYEWDLEPEQYLRPKIGIDKFLSSLEVEILHVGYQVWVRKSS
jgi:hypothetical protein